MIITALIVTYNRLEKLKACVDATVKAGFNNIVIINNCSSDGTFEWLNTIRESNIHIIHNPENTGGAGGFKKGLEYIKDNIEGHWVALFDDDAYPSSDFVVNFTKAAVKPYSAFCSKVLGRDNKPCRMNLPFTRLPASFREDVSYIVKSEEFVPLPEQESECVTFSFVGLILKQELIAPTLHYIHDELFIYFDDVYYAWHLSTAGHHFLYDPSLVFFHDVSAVSKVVLPQWKIYYLTRNLLLSLFIFKGTRPYTRLGISLRLIKYFFLTFQQPDKRLYLSCLMKGVWHGVKGIKGKKH